MDRAIGKDRFHSIAGREPACLGDNLSVFILHEGVASLQNAFRVERQKLGVQDVEAISPARQRIFESGGRAGREGGKPQLLSLHGIPESCGDLQGR